MHHQRVISVVSAKSCDTGHKYKTITDTQVYEKIWSHGELLLH